MSLMNIFLLNSSSCQCLKGAPKNPLLIKLHLPRLFYIHRYMLQTQQEYFLYIHAIDNGSAGYIC